VNKSTAAFILLCVAATAPQLLGCYGLLHWGAEKDAVLTGLLVAGLVLEVTLFVWSLGSVRHHKPRCIFGTLVCAYCLCQAFHNGKIIF
jgi:hypothetical protein